MSSDPTHEESTILSQEATRFGGYEILAEVSRDEMGVVYKARHQSLDRVVALKLVQSGSNASDGELRRFHAEAKAAARLDHPHIVPVYEIGQHEGQNFFTMGFVDGPSLSTRLAQSGPLPPRVAAEILRKIAEAVDYAHRQGVIHRDLQPGNVLLTPTGEPKVTNFGLAKRLDSEQSVTATGQVFGTPAYMSPEQVQGDRAVIGPATDVYSLGATLYAALTGRPPFAATVIHDLLIQINEQPALSLRALNAGVPAALEMICLKCLSKTPADRYPSAGALAEDLGQFLDSSRVNVSRRNSVAKVGLSVAVVAIVLIAGVWFGRHLLVGSSPGGTSDASPIPQQVSVADEQLLRSLSAAQDALLPLPTGNLWEFRYADGAAACEQAFREFGFTLDQDTPSKLAESLKHRSPEFRDSVIRGLELWELCATAAKQMAIIEPLQQAQDALDTLAWRRSLRQARSEADTWDMFQIVRDALSESPTPAQTELLALLIGSRSPELHPDSLNVLRNLVQKSPESFLSNLVLAATLQSIGRVRPKQMVAYSKESVVPLQSAANARQTSALPHEQLAAAFFDLDNSEAMEIEHAQAMQLLSPKEWPVVTAARAARKERQTAEFILNQGGNVSVFRPNESVRWEINPLNPDLVVVASSVASIEQLPKSDFVLRSAGLFSANDADVKHVAKCVGLHSLYLWKAPITDNSLDYLNGLSQLKTLGLVGGHFSAAGLSQWSPRLKEMKSIEILDLGLTPLDDDALPAIGEMHQLTYLSLVGTQITDAGLVHLQKLRSLKTLYLGATKVSENGLATIRQALPDCNIPP